MFRNAQQCLEMLCNAVHCENLPKILLKVYQVSISRHLASATETAVLREDAQKSSVMFRNDTLQSLGLCCNRIYRPRPEYWKRLKSPRL